MASPTQNGEPGGDLPNLIAQVEVLRRVDGRRALAAARDAHRLAVLSGSPRLAALAARALATALRDLSRNREALHLYREASDLFRGHGETVEAARTEIGRINALMYLGRYREAIASASSARRVLARHGERVRVMRLDLNTGNIYKRLERYRESLRCYDRARRAAQLDPDPFSLALVDNNRANVLTMLGRAGEAESIYRRLIDDAERQGLERIAAHTRYNLGYLRFLGGHYDEALELFEEARRRFAAEGDSSYVGSCDLDRAEVLVELNQLPEAARLARAAERVFARHRLRAERARSLWLRGVAAGRLGRPAEAQRLLAAARRLFLAEGNRTSVAMTDLARAAIHQRKGRPALACRLARAARGRFRQEGLPLKRLQAEVTEARALLAAGRLPAAARAARRARRGAGRVPPPWLEYQSYHVLGKVASARGDPRALELYRRAISGIERLRQGVQVDEHRIGLLADKMEVFEDAVRAALEGKRRRFDLAFEFVERAKARALLDALNSSRTELERARRSARADRLEREILGLYNLLNASGRSPERGSGRAAHTSLLRRVRSCEDSLARIEARQPAARAERAAGPSATAPPLDQVQAALGPGQALIEFFSQRGAISALTISRRSVDYHPGLIGTEEVHDLLERFRLLCTSTSTRPAGAAADPGPAVAAVSGILGRLGEALAPALPDPGAAPDLLIVPHGPLHYLPLHACMRGGAPICSAHAVEYAPSATVWHASARAGEAARPTGDGPVPGGVLLVGPPDGGLPGARREIELLRTCFPGATVLTGPDCRREAILEQLPGASLVHFATHCIFRPDRPALSGLELADGWLRPLDLSGIRLRAELVTLSACGTGPGHVRAGDEIIGLVRGFLAAGATHILASLWPVSDEPTQTFMSRFYGHLGDEPARLALQHTMESMRAGSRHPYLWAPFVLYARRLDGGARPAAPLRVGRASVDAAEAVRAGAAGVAGAPKAAKHGMASGGEAC